ncbi:MAG: carboxylate-amine ligase [Halieaceae bacterium]|jgi:glutamate---cysteine ligase / carboxylate-amine ligase|nr:carboxylate-amine ligase [Halieaceae bacterium]
MILPEPAFTLGVEEEYLLVDRETRDLVSDPPPELMQECKKRCGDQVSAELMRSQIEIGTRVCSDVKVANEEVRELRQIIAEVTSKYGYAPIAVSTHPFARWLSQKQTEGERYIDLTREMQAAARRMLICGMHVHVGIEDPDLRIDLMNQLPYFLPHLLALSCSSPFWEGENTGLRSYRLTVFDALPRTGLPEQFVSFAEYERHVDVLIRAGIVEDASKIWWDLRPSARFPTLETRIMDVCTRVEDAISLVALTVCLHRMLYRLRRDNQRWRIYARMLINENRWRAMRYSYDEGMIDFGEGEVVPFPTLLDELIGFVAEDAQALNCEAELARLPEILTRGSSAHKQVSIYDSAIVEGHSRQQALNAVVDWLISETVR